jgi:hypothetical protein
MKTNIKIELSDEARRIMASNLKGKLTSKMATRADINEFVRGCIDRISGSVCIGEPTRTDKVTSVIRQRVRYIETQDVTPKSWFTEEERETVEGLRALGQNDSYIRGWLQVGRKS